MAASSWPVPLWQSGFSSRLAIAFFYWVSRITREKRHLWPSGKFPKDSDSGRLRASQTKPRYSCRKETDGVARREFAGFDGMPTEGSKSSRTFQIILGKWNYARLWYGNLFSAAFHSLSLPRQESGAPRNCLPDRMSRKLSWNPSSASSNKVPALSIVLSQNYSLLSCSPISVRCLI